MEGSEETAEEQCFQQKETPSWASAVGVSLPSVGALIVGGAMPGNENRGSAARQSHLMEETGPGFCARWECESGTAPGAWQHRAGPCLSQTHVEP